MKNCPHCGKAEVGPGFVTCGASECQEASYLANKMRNVRGKRKRADLADRLAQHCERFGVVGGE